MNAPPPPPTQYPWEYSWLVCPHTRTYLGISKFESDGIHFVVDLTIAIVGLATNTHTNSYNFFFFFKPTKEPKEEATLQ